MNLENKVAIISGASAGLDTVVSRRFHEAGGCVVLAGTRPTGVEALAEKFGQARAFPVAAN